jgi:hypothetical protein
MNLSLKKRLSRPLLAFLAVSIALTSIVATGCRSAGKPASASFASVVIANRSVEEIQQAAVAVFQGDGYQAFRDSAGKMVFEKEASQRSNMAYSGVIGAHYGARTNVRVRAEIVDLGAGSRRLQCKAYMVTDAGDSFFEKEQPLANFRGRPYQELLDEAARRLK